METNITVGTLYYLVGNCQHPKLVYYSTKLMKKTILLLGIILISINSYASHLMGGMIGVFQTSYDSTTIGVALITDGQTPIPMPTSITVEKWEMNSVGWYVQNGTITLTQGTLSIPFQGQLLTNYTSEYLDLDSNKYRFIYRNCCWPMLNNSTNSMNSEFIISTDYWHIPYNSTPYARVPFIINQQVNTRNTMKPLWGWNNFLDNPDSWGDVVTISQTDIYSGYANGVFVPQTYTQLSMHVDNDSISWVPSTLGRFATGFEIADYRNGDKIGIQRIQWTFMVVNSTIGVEEHNKEINYVVYDFNGNIIYEGAEIPYEVMDGLYIISDGIKPKKIRVVK